MDLNRENIKALLLDIVSENLQQSKSEMKLGDAHQEYLRWAEYNLSAKTIIGASSAYKHLISYRGDVLLSEINFHFVSLFMVELMKKVPSGHRVYFRATRAEFNKFVEWGFISHNNFAKFKLPKRQKNEPKYFVESEILLLVEHENNQSLKALYSFAFYSGLRLGELISLTWDNVCLKEKYVRVGDDSFTTKSKKIRRVPLCTKSVRILESLIPKVYHATKRDFVFRKSNSFPFSANYVSKRFKKLLRSCGYSKEYHFHCIRHSTASNLAQLNVPVPNIQEILGHANVQTTMVYTHANFSDLVNSISVFDKNNLEKSEVCNDK